MAEPLSAEGAFDEVRVRFLGRPHVDEGRMFRTRGLRYRGKFFAALSRDDQLLVKLPEARVTELITTGVSLPFDANKGTPMREWTLVPLASVDHWNGIAEEAFAFAESLSRGTSSRSRTR
jgi:hypothetical protein